MTGFLSRAHCCGACLSVSLLAPQRALERVSARPTNRWGSFSFFLEMCLETRSIFNNRPLIDRMLSPNECISKRRESQAVSVSFFFCVNFVNESVPCLCAGRLLIPWASTNKDKIERSSTKEHINEKWNVKSGDRVNELFFFILIMLASAYALIIMANIDDQLDEEKFNSLWIRS